MISGVMPCSGWLKTGYPWELAIRCWVRVCDEIVIVTHGTEDRHWLSVVEKKYRKVKVVVIQGPPLDSFPTYGAYLLYGIFYCRRPSWVINIEADYLISPTAAKALKAALVAAKPHYEIVMAQAVTLNYDGSKTLYKPEFARWFPPKDGVTWDRPIGCRPSRGVLPIPFSGWDRDRYECNCEGL